jgi:hypothetical protein
LIIVPINCYEWDGTQFVGLPDEDFTVEQCIDLFTGSSLPLFYTDCVHPIYNLVRRIRQQ